MPSQTTTAASLQQVLHLPYEDLKDGFCPQVKKVLHRLSICRTPTLGFHLYRCSQQACGHVHYQYHSCRDRHCPRCGALKKSEWIEARTRELLPVRYYHVVFTLPHELNALVLGHQKELYRLLFEASSTTLLSFGRDAKYLDARLGIISVLHTWGQQLCYHPHIHAIVSGGGITKGLRWKEALKNDWRFLFPVKAMAMVYRARYLKGLKRLINHRIIHPPDGIDIKALFDLLYLKPWVVYAKAPFGGPQQVIKYLGRYTHKVAISNHRIKAINPREGTVTFQYHDYRDGKQKLMTLTGGEFIRRFSQHILPRSFTKIRMYGYLCNRGKQERMSAVLKALKCPQHPSKVNVPFEVRLREQYGMELRRCPLCGQNTLDLIGIYLPWKKADDG
jgi:hypothetical protein